LTSGFRMKHRFPLASTTALGAALGLAVALAVGAAVGASAEDKSGRPGRDSGCKMTVQQKKAVVALTRAADYKLRLEDYEQAISNYSKAIAIAPDCNYLYCERGNAYKRRGDNKQAIADYSRALKIQPADEAILRQRGTLYETIRDFANAIADYDACIKLGGQAHRDRARIYMLQKKCRPAVADFSQAIKNKPDVNILIQLYRDRARAYDCLDNKKLAEADRKTVLELTEKLYGENISDYPKVK